MTGGARFRSWVNGAETVDGGDHVDAVTDAFNDAGESPSFVLVNVVMRKPRYAGPTKDKLETDWVAEELRPAVASALKASFD